MEIYIKETEQTVGADLLAAVIDEVKALPDVWQKLNREKQQDVIDRMRRRVESQVKEAVLRIASQERPSIKAILGEEKTKTAIEAKITMSREDPQRHALRDAVGKTVLIVVIDPEDHTEGMEGIEADPDQADLITGEVDDVYYDAVTFSADKKTMTISGLQRHLKIGYNRAARIIDAMKARGIVTGDNGVYRVAGNAED